MNAFDQLKERTGGPDGATHLERVVVAAAKVSYLAESAKYAAEELARLQAIAEAAELLVECIKANELLEIKTFGHYVVSELSATALAAYEAAKGEQ